MALPATVAVYLDYENMHRTGHDLFGRDGERPYDTVLDPLEIARRLIAKRHRPSHLEIVRVFRGRPVPERQPKPASKNDQQVAAWEASDPRVEVVQRDLKYVELDGGAVVPREKGIDVALAISLVEDSIWGSYDVAIVFSGDTDLIPALELAFRRTSVHLEIASWAGRPPLWFADELRATPPRMLPYCHYLEERDFRESRDASVR